jgi:DNA-binding response OmpR family regulator
MTETTDKKKRILIAEDDPVSRRLLEVFLVKWGFEVVVATNGTDALALLERMDAPRLAVLDWMMPGLEGVQVCQKLRATTDRPYVYVLLLTARAQKEDLLHGLECGADDYLTKPFDPDELLKKIQETAIKVWEKTHTEQGKEEKRIRFSCRCGKRFKVSPVHRGKTLSCPECGEPVTVPHRV